MRVRCWGGAGVNRSFSFPSIRRLIEGVNRRRRLHGRSPIQTPVNPFDCDAPHGTIDTIKHGKKPVMMRAFSVFGNQKMEGN
jgi:hypothetical protein